MPEKPGVNRKTRSDDVIFLFSKIRVYRRKSLVLYGMNYTKNDAFTLILKSNFDFKQQKKMKKNDIFFDSQNYIIFDVNVWIFSGTSGYRSQRKLLEARTRRFPITCLKLFDDISNLWPVIWSSDLGYLKKSYLIEI